MFSVTLFNIVKILNFFYNDLNFSLNFNFSFKKIIFKNLIFLKEYNNILIIFNNIIYFKYFSLKYIKNIHKYKILLFNLKNICFKVFKAYGINMRILRLAKKKRKNLLFFRLGFSHGFVVHLSRLFFFRVFKRRYFLVVGNDYHYLNNLAYQITSLRKFFRYKLIGVKGLRDRFFIKIGKKKSF